MNPGPAPTLVTDWFTWAFVLAAVATFALVVLTVEILHARETLSQKRLDAVADDARLDQQVADYHCVARGHYYRKVEGVWLCLSCGHTVRPVETVFDQEAS